MVQNIFLNDPLIIINYYNKMVNCNFNLTYINYCIELQ